MHYMKSFTTRPVLTIVMLLGATLFAYSTLASEVELLGKTGHTVRINTTESSLRAFCRIKGNFALKVLADRNTKEVTEQEQIDTILNEYDSARKIDKDSTVAWHVILDMQRIVRDIYRREDKEFDPNRLRTKTIIECLNGGY